MPELLHKLPRYYHIIGDSAYAIEQHILTPYRDTGSLTEAQKFFNYCLSANRMIIENCIGNLKNKFPRVHSMLHVRSNKRAVMIIRSCVHLLNFIIDNEIQSRGILPHNVEGRDTVELPADGKGKRDTICNFLSRDRA